MIIVPAAYDHYTWGPRFWELIGRARAFDNQVYFAELSGARNYDTKNYVLYGRTQIIDPYGQIKAQAGEDEETIYAELGKCLSNVTPTDTLNCSLIASHFNCRL